MERSQAGISISFIILAIGEIIGDKWTAFDTREVEPLNWERTERILHLSSSPAIPEVIMKQRSEDRRHQRTEDTRGQRENTQRQRDSGK